MADLKALTSEALLTPESQKLLQDIFSIESIDSITQNTWKYMCVCFDTPRPSAKEEQIRSRFQKIAHSLGLSYKTDEIGNLVIKKPASPGFETKTNIVIQAHMDMVTSKRDDSNHNFDTDRINAYLTEDKKWVLSGDTTLGADNGIGCAAGLAVIEECIVKNLQMPQIELLITVEEETTMAGALQADAIILDKPTALINCDSEEHQRVCLGCAGGGEVKLTKVVETEQIDASKYNYVSITLGSFNGGHSGVDIHQGRGNAIKLLLGEVIAPLAAKFGDNAIRMTSIQGGNAVNAIPRNATAKVFVCAEKFDEVSTFVAEILAKLHNQFALVESKVSHPQGLALEQALEAWKPTLTITPITTEATCAVTTAQQTQLLQLAAEIPHGVIDWSKDVEGFVETSNSFSIVALEDVNVAASTSTPSTLLFHCFFRSTVDAALLSTAARLQELAKKYAFDATEMFNDFPGWAPRGKDGPLFQATLRGFQNAFGPDAPEMDAYVIHAGLESGCLAKVWPSLHQVSIGPTILDAHSFYEKIQVDTVQPFCRWLMAIIADLATVEQSAFAQQ